MANNIPASVNYTNRDFYSLRDELIARVQARVQENGKNWTATEPSDFGVAMVEAFSYVGDIANYYIDRVANEGYLQTATQRQNLLNIAELFGYTPTGYRQSSVLVTFSNSGTGTGVTIPAGTELTVDVINNTTVNQLTFTLQSDVVVAAAAGALTPSTASGVALHGFSVDMLDSNAASSLDNTDIAGELLGYSDGLANQTFALHYNLVADNSVQVYVNDGNFYSLWTHVTHIADYGPQDNVYTLSFDANDYVTVTFGDGVSGAIPVLGAPIKSVYTVGGGAVGNIEGGKQFHISKVPADSGVAIETLSLVIASSSSGSPATGGEDPESNDSIRENAPAALRTLNRAVTLQDYQDLALTVQNVGKAYATAIVPNSVTMYVAPSVSDISEDYYPGYNAGNTATTGAWASIKEAVSGYFIDKSQVGVSLTVSPPTYVDAKVGIQYKKQDMYTHSQITSAIKYGVVYGFGYNFLNFNTPIYPEQIESSLIGVPGISLTNVVNLYRNGDSAARTTLSPLGGEYFVFRDENVNVYPIASLSNLVLSHGTLSFDAGTMSYTVTDISTSTITVTPTTLDASWTIKVNGENVTSGSPSASISTSASTTITVVVSTADGLTTNTYTISVVR
jgi:hypothetical protein